MRRTTLVLLVAVVGCACGDTKQNTGKKAGETCVASADCQDNLCHQAMCVSAKAAKLSDPCANNGECRSLRCVTGKCATGATTAGAACIFDEQCAADPLCVKGKCAGGGGPDGGAKDSGTKDGSPPKG